MSRRCTVCAHPDRHDIDAALVDGAASIRRIAAHYSLAESSVRRHAAKHMPAALVKAQEAAEEDHALNLVQQLSAANATAWSMVKEARAESDRNGVLRALDRVQRQLEFQAKLLGELDERPQVNVILSPQWLQLRRAVLVALSPYPEARRAVSVRLLELERTS